MEQSPTYNLWRPVPDGAILTIRANGDANHFHVVARANCDDAAAVTWTHEELVPGPRTRAIRAGESCSYAILMNVMSAPPQPIELQASLTDANGAALRDATWRFDAPGAHAIVIDVIAS